MARTKEPTREEAEAISAAETPGVVAYWEVFGSDPDGWAAVRREPDGTATDSLGPFRTEASATSAAAKKVRKTEAGTDEAVMVTRW